MSDLEAFPGGDLVAKGLADLRAGRESVESLLVLQAESRLRELGLDVPDAGVVDPDWKMYRLIERELGDGAHSRYNALRRQLASFMRAFTCASR